MSKDDRDLQKDIEDYDKKEPPGSKEREARRAKIAKNWKNSSAAEFVRTMNRIHAMAVQLKKDKDSRMEQFSIEEATTDSMDIICVNVPLFIRLLEHAREDVKKDVDLHIMAENCLSLMDKEDVLSMNDYEKIVGKNLVEDGAMGGAPTNNVGSGAIKGAAGDPPGPTRTGKKILRRKPVIESTDFMGAKVFDVDPTFFHNCRMSKRHYARFEDYVGGDETGQQIREYANSNWGKAIIVRDSTTGAMCYLRYGNQTIGD